MARPTAALRSPPASAPWSRSWPSLAPALVPPAMRPCVAARAATTSPSSTPMTSGSRRRPRFQLAAFEAEPRIAAGLRPRTPVRQLRSRRGGGRGLRVPADAPAGPAHRRDAGTRGAIEAIGPWPEDVRVSDGLSFLLRAARARPRPGDAARDGHSLRRVHGGNHSLGNRDQRREFARHLKALARPPPREGRHERGPRQQADDEQLLVLHAALDDREPRLAAWRRWRAGVDSTTSTTAQPACCRSSTATSGPIPSTPRSAGRLKGLYRRSWSHNQLLFKRAGGGDRRARGGRYRDAGDQGRLARRCSPTATSGCGRWTTSMCWCRSSAPRTAIAALSAAGWSPDHDGSLRPGPRSTTRSALPAATSGNVDLHWFSLWQPANDEELWRASVPLELGGVATRAPGAADQLLLACVHGTPWSPLPPFRWIADAAAVIRNAGERAGLGPARRRGRAAAAHGGHPGGAGLPARASSASRSPRRRSSSCERFPPPGTSAPPSGLPAGPTRPCARCNGLGPLPAPARSRHRRARDPTASSSSHGASGVSRASGSCRCTRPGAQPPARSRCRSIRALKARKRRCPCTPAVAPG